MWMQTECCEGYKVRGLQEQRDSGWRITTWPEGKDFPGKQHLVKDGVFYKLNPDTAPSPTEWQKARFGDVDLDVDPTEKQAVLTLVKKWDARVLVSSNPFPPQ
jgi:hypothetical protein